MSIKTIVFSLIAVATFAYPFIVYNSLSQLGPSVLSLVLFVLLLARVILRGEYDKPEQYVQLFLVGALCLFAAWQKSETMLRLYPVVMSLCFAFFFAISLRSETTLVERFAQMFINDIEDYQRVYMRSLTKVWAYLLVINAAVAAYTAYFLSLAQWTLYNGFIAYFIFAAFSLVEWGYRFIYKKRYHRLQNATAMGTAKAKAKAMQHSKAAPSESSDSLRS